MWHNTFVVLAAYIGICWLVYAVNWHKHNRPTLLPKRMRPRYRDEFQKGLKQHPVRTTIIVAYVLGMTVALLVSIINNPNL